jgi:CubicO group peptidase (beta-lactamase class C family)
VTEDTIFGVASVTKSFTALAVQTLAARGAVALTDPVSDYLPLTLWRDTVPATLEHFLNHTSGLPPLPTMTWLRGPTQAGDPVTDSDAELVAKMAAEAGGLPDVSTFDGLVAYLNDAVKLLGPPGRYFSYSNDAFCLLGAVVERVSGMTFSDYVTTTILAPLGMTRSTFDVRQVRADGDHSTLYARDTTGAVRASPQWEDAGVMRAGGALKSTLADLRRYVRFLMDPARATELGLRPEHVRRLGTGSVWSGVGLQYGLGLNEQQAPYGGTVIGHDGGLKGVSSRIGWLPATEHGPRVGAVVLTNLAGVPVDLLHFAGINAVSGMPLGARAYVPTTYSPSESEYARVLGSYASGEPYGRVRLYRCEDGELRAAVGDPVEDLPAAMVGRDEVAVTGAFKTFPLRMVLDDAGEVIGVFYGSRVLLRQ